jgi:hypothetical protein
VFLVEKNIQFLMELRKNNDRLKLIGMNYKDTKNNAKNFLDELGNPYDKIIFDSKRYYMQLSGEHMVFQSHF